MPNCGNQIKFFKELSYHKSLTERIATPATLGRAGTGLGLGSKARACRWARNFFTWKKPVSFSVRLIGLNVISILLQSSIKCSK